MYLLKAGDGLLRRTAIQFVGSLGIHQQYVSIAHVREVDASRTGRGIAQGRTFSSPELRPFVVVYRIVVADNNRVNLSVSGINTIGVVPESVDELTALVIVAEQETVEGIDMHFAVALTPRTDGLTFVGIVGGTLQIAGVTG